MKKTERLELRGTPEEVQAFEKACDLCGANKSAVIRDLCRASVLYMNDNCKDGRWRTPVLITERQAAAMDIKADVVQIHNGTGHQKARNHKGVKP